MNRFQSARWSAALVGALAACGGGGGGGPIVPDAPVIESLDIQGSIRAGEVLVIRGRGLNDTRVPRGLSPAATVEILLDGRVLTPESATATEIRVRIPLDIAPGPHTLSVRVDGRASNSVAFTVEIFTVTGTYRGPGRIASATCNDPAVQEQLREQFPPGETGTGTQAVLDERPDLTLISQDFSQPGVFEAFGRLEVEGTFHAVVEGSDDDVLSEKDGRFEAVGDRVTLDSTDTITLDADGLVCVVEVELTQERFTTQFEPPPGSQGLSAARVAEALRGLAR